MIPILDLQSQHAEIRAELDAALARVLDSGGFILGDEVAAFEREFAVFCGAAHAVAVNSGTSALHLALLAAGAGPGDEVITTPFTFIATVAAIGYTGAKPVFVDIDPASYHIDAARLEAAVTKRAKAIIPVHLFGQPADMDAIGRVAREHGLANIEDAAQAHGAEHKGRRAGALGDLGCFSFYPSKNLGGCGEGGIVTTNNPEHAEKLRRLRNWGQERKYVHVIKGFNYRMDGFQGAVLRVKLRRLERWNEARRAIAAAYDRLLAEAGLAGPARAPETTHVFHQYVIRAGQRDRLQQALLERGIQTAIHYPNPVHLEPPWAELGYAAGSFPHAERAAREVLSLPMYPTLAPAAVEQVGAALADLRALVRGRG
mgnify:CR=1 FL=1